MAKDRYLSTSSNTPIISPDFSGADSVLQEAGKSINIASDKFNASIQRYETSNRKAQDMGLLQQQKEKQRDLAIPEAAMNIQRASLAALNVTLGVREGVRRQQEEEQASSFSMDFTASTELDHLKAQPELMKLADQDGTGLLEATVAWWDKKEKELYDNAPSEAAKIKALSVFESLRSVSQMDAVGAEGKMRDAYSKYQVKRAQESIVQKSVVNPDNYAAHINEFNSIAENLKANGYKEYEIDSQRNHFKAQILETAADSFLKKGDLTSVYGLITGDLGDTVSPDVLEGTVNKYFKASETHAKNLEAARNMQMLEDLNKSGNLTSDISGSKKFMQSRFTESHLAIKAASAALETPADRAQFYSSKKLEVARSSTFVPASEITASEFRLNNSTDPESSIAEATYIMNLSTSPDLMNKFSGYSDDAILKAQMIYAYADPGQGSQIAPDVVMQRIEDETRLSKDGAVIKARKEQWTDLIAGGMIYDSKFKNEALDETDPTAFLENTLFPDKDPNLFWDYFDDVDKHQASTAQKFYATKVKEIFMKTGSIDSARSAARTITRQKWGITDVNGTARLMYNPPDDYFKGNEKSLFDEAVSRKVTALGADSETTGLIYRGVEGDSVVYGLKDNSTGDYLSETLPNGHIIDARVSVSMKAAREYSLQKEKNRLMGIKVKPVKDIVAGNIDPKTGKISGKSVPSETLYSIMGIDGMMERAFGPLGPGNDLQSMNAYLDRLNKNLADLEDRGARPRTWGSVGLTKKMKAQRNYLMKKIQATEGKKGAVEAQIKDINKSIKELSDEG